MLNKPMFYQSSLGFTNLLFSLGPPVRPTENVGKKSATLGNLGQLVVKPI